MHRTSIDSLVSEMIDDGVKDCLESYDFSDIVQDEIDAHDIISDGESAIEWIVDRAIGTWAENQSDTADHVAERVDVLESEVQRLTACLQLVADFLKPDPATHTDSGSQGCEPPTTTPETQE